MGRAVGPVQLDGRRVDRIDRKTVEECVAQFVTSEGIHNFSSNRALTTWLTKKPALQADEEVREARAAQLRHRYRRMSEKERMAEARRVGNMLDLERRAMEARMKIAGVRSGEDLHRTREPLVRGMADSAWLYKKPNRSNFCFYLPVNSTIPYLLGCNDAVTSLTVWTGYGAAQSLALWEDSWYRGRKLVVIASVQEVTRRIGTLKGYPHYFNDKASSAMLTLF